MSFNEEINPKNKEKNNKRRSWPELKQSGPNINIKVPKRTFNSQEERIFFTKQITLKQKTEVIFSLKT